MSTDIIISIDPGSYKTGLCIWHRVNESTFEIASLRLVEVKQRYGKQVESAPKRCARIIAACNHAVDIWRDCGPIHVAYEAPQVPGQNQKALTLVQGAIAGWAGVLGAEVYDYHQSTLKAILLDPPHTKAKAQEYVLASYPALKERSEDEIDAVFTGLAHIRAILTA